MNLKLSLVFAAVGFVLSASSAFLYQFSYLNEDQKITFLASYVVTLGFGYYTFQFLLQGNRLARKVLLVLCSIALVLGAIDIVRNFTLDLHFLISLTLLFIGLGLLYLLLSPPLVLWLDRVNEE
ncbi:hypothetical protein SAMN02745866_01449 [Alteromonadaceae bacterium Bs31]|nr:hypothetical protein SAMN02745866_01449 [Alteromonadaceae bacterium Bs31]